MKRVCLQMIHLTSDKDRQGHGGKGKLYMNNKLLSLVTVSRSLDLFPPVISQSSPQCTAYVSTQMPPLKTMDS